MLHSEFDLSQPKMQIVVRVALVLLAVCVAMVSFWPLRNGGFVTDDDVFRLTSALVTHPWSAFYTNHFFEPYYYRPVGLVFWWCAYALMGDSFVGHVVVNVLLHLANAWLLFFLLRQWRVAFGVATVAGFAFAFVPYSAAVAFWPSARFDLLCVFFALVALIAALRALDAPPGRFAGWLLAMSVGCVLSCWSKEQGYAMAAGLALVCALAAAASKRRVENELARRLTCVVVVLLVTTVSAFAVRAVVLVSPFELVGAAPERVLVEGVQEYFAVFGRSTFALFQQGSRVGAALGLLLLLGSVVLIVRAGSFVKGGRQVSSAMLPLVVGFAILVAQAPITRVWTVLVDSDAFAAATYARFHYALAACVLACLAKWASGRVLALASITLVVSVLLLGAGSTRGLAGAYASWSAEYASIASASARAVAATNGTVKSPECVVVLLGLPESALLFKLFSDASSKAVARAQGDRLLRCSVMTETTPRVFVYPAEFAPMLVLPFVEVSPGKAKNDYVWSGIRYRYRLPPKEAKALPDAAFLDWRAGRFVDVTAAVHAGERGVVMRGW